MEHRQEPGDRPETEPVYRGARNPTEGVVPPGRRRLFAWSVIAIGVVVLIVGVVISFASQEPISWGALMTAVGLVMGWYGFYLWVRLAD